MMREPMGIEHDYANRLARAAEESRTSGVDALIVTPSPDLEYLLGYEAPLLERLTALVTRPGKDPVLIVPQLEVPRASASPAGDHAEMQAWSDGNDPFDSIRKLLPETGTYGVTDTMWAMHVLKLEEALPHATFVLASSVLSN